MHIFTHLENHNGLEPDVRGLEFASVDDAIIEAARTAGGALTDDLAAGRTPITINLYLETSVGERVATVRVEAAIDRG